MNLYDIRKNIINELEGLEKEIVNCKEYLQAMLIRDNIISLYTDLVEVEKEIWVIENMED